MRHPPPCNFDDSIAGGASPDTDFCTCPRQRYTSDQLKKCATDMANSLFCEWIVKRIAQIEKRILASQANAPETIALSGQLTAFKNTLEYAKSHGIT